MVRVADDARAQHRTEMYRSVRSLPHSLGLGAVVPPECLGRERSAVVRLRSTGGGPQWIAFITD